MIKAPRVFIQAVSRTLVLAGILASLFSCAASIPSDPAPAEYLFRLTLGGDAYTNIVLSGKTNILIPAFVFYDNGSGGWFKFVNNNHSPRYYFNQFADFNSTKIITLSLETVGASQATYTRTIWVSYHYGTPPYKVPFVFGLSTLGKGGTNVDMEDQHSATNLVTGEMMFVTNNYFTNTGGLYGYLTSNMFVREIVWSEGELRTLECTAVKFKSYAVIP